MRLWTPKIEEIQVKMADDTQVLEEIVLWTQRRVMGNLDEDVADKLLVKSLNVILHRHMNTPIRKGREPEIDPPDGAA